MDELFLHQILPSLHVMSEIIAAPLYQKRLFQIHATWGGSSAISSLPALVHGVPSKELWLVHGLSFFLAFNVACIKAPPPPPQPYCVIPW